jgi:hypothetical protein
MDYTPEWLTFEISKALSALTTRKQRTTVLRLAEAAAADKPQPFERADVCSQNTWYGRYKDGVKLPGWRDDPAIQHALELATARAQDWEDTHITRQIARTRRQLADHAPSVERSLSLLALGAQSESVRRQACLDILDRVGAELASKAAVPNAPSGGEMTVKFDLSNVPADALAAVAGEGEQGAEGPVAEDVTLKEETE